MDYFENDRNFKEAIGDFIIDFSELEFGLVELCSLIDFDLRKKEETYLKYMGFQFEKKKECLTEFIKENIPDLINIWDSLNEIIGRINHERRFIVHGVMRYYLPNESISTIIKVKNKPIKNEITIDKINKLTKQIHELNFGQNGICGEFNILFKTNVFNKWNDLVNDTNKIVYKVENEILTKFNG